MRAVIALVSMWCSLAAAQPAKPARPPPTPACAPCAKGDALIVQFSVQVLRPLAPELAALAIEEPLTVDDYARIVEIRRRQPSLARLGAIDDADFAPIASSLCNAISGPCIDATILALRCLADRCDVAFPKPANPDDADVIEVPPSCRESSDRPRPPAIGLGLDWGTGWQRSRYPTDSGAWSLGISGRLRFGRHLGVVARVDRIAGRDEATDEDGNGNDDFSTGSITRIAALAGPSIVLDHTKFEGESRIVRLDLLAGYLTTASQEEESGLAAGVDLAFQLAFARAGIRFVQGFGDASHATLLLGHIGFLAGAAPEEPRDRNGCAPPTKDRSTRLALAFEYPLGGYGISSELGYLASGLAFEAIWHATRMLDLVVRADLLAYPGGDRDRVIHHAGLAGFRLDHSSRGRRARTGFFTTVQGGYSQHAGLSPSSVGPGPIVDLSFGWGGQDDEGAAFLRLHGRFGVSPDNVDHRVLFLSFGAELRLDPRRWKDRDRY